MILRTVCNSNSIALCAVLPCTGVIPQAPLTTLLTRNKLKPGDVDAVELLGGGSRVPKLQAVLSEALGGR